MKLHRPRLRLVCAFALTLGLALGGAACDKGGSTDKPEGGKNRPARGDDTPPAEGGKEYVYAAEGFVLNATVEFKSESKDKQGQGEAKINARTRIEATPAGAGKLKIHYTMIELIKYEGSGQLEPEFMQKQIQEQSGKVIDVLDNLAKSESWLIVDQKGKVDGAATKALPENQTGEDDEIPRLANVFGLFTLPMLPSVDLVEGKKILRARDEERPLGDGNFMPMQTDEAWTLSKIDANRIAEFTALIESSGAKIFSEGGRSASVSILGESGFTIAFNLDTKLPVSLNGYIQSEFAIDIEGMGDRSFTTNNEITVTYEPG